MGRGVARQARERYPSLPELLGALLRNYGNHVFPHPTFQLFTFPVKHAWREPADIALIHCSVLELDRHASGLGLTRVWLVRPGCGNGGLLWEVVRPLLADMLDDRFVVVHPT